MKRLVLMGEGDGDRESLVVLAKKLLAPLSPWDALQLDPNVITLGDLPALLSSKRQGEHDRGKWLNRLRHAAKRRGFGGALVILDGDAKHRVLGEQFCAKRQATQLVEMARTIGAGSVFSLAVVFARQEYESWLIAGVNSLVGKLLKDGMEGVLPETIPPEGDLELAPRDAKRWLSDHMRVKYKPARDQAELTKYLEIELVRGRGMRSFQRLENAISQLVDSFRSGACVATPS